jgi:hypothetical protein
MEVLTSSRKTYDNHFSLIASGSSVQTFISLNENNIIFKQEYPAKSLRQEL